ncbi:membrane-spanning 4-domains subfamily A member 4A-like [Pseudophryne corroboree]|uniref:membrane-spanning 4-domains subfamily A member 4A-like n=1 Tax=Pseudophryne corroboree TaxID=495146 RepID=UPI00308185EE
MSLYADSEATTHIYETLLSGGFSAVPKLNRLPAPNYHNGNSRPPAYNAYPATQVYTVPPEVLQWNLAAVVPQNLDISNHFFRTFRKGKPKALGIVLIVAAVLQIPLGIAFVFVKQSITLFSGLPFWGAIFYIIAGSLTIAAQSKPSRCLVRGSLSLNIISTIISVVSLIINSVEMAIDGFYYYYDDGVGNTTEYHKKQIIGYILSTLLLFISLLLFCVTLSVSIFGCRSLAHAQSNVTQVFVMQKDVSTVPGPLPPSPTSSVEYDNVMY